MTERRWPLAAVLAVLALAVPPFLPPYWLSILVLGVIYAVLAMGLNVLMGYTGLDSLGQAAFFGTAAYGVGLLTAERGVGWLPAAAVGLVAATVVAGLFGLVAVRLKGLYFLLITLALGQVLWGAALRWGDVTGGWNGLRGVTRPAQALSSPLAFYYFALAIAVAAGLALAVLVRSPFGLALRGIRERELRSTTLGYDTYRHKEVAFVLAGLLAGVAGILNATYIGFVSPRDLSIELSFDAMLMVILGGPGTLAGPVLGALAVTALRYLLSVYVENYWLIILGLVFVAATVWLPRGVVGLVPTARERRARELERAGRPETPPPADIGGVFSVRGAEAAGDGPALELTGIGKSFGDVRVLEDVDLRVAPGERVGVIGLNGAGKTTLFQVITGVYAPTSGRIALLGRDATALSASSRARLGLARTFQVTMLYPKLTAGENIALALLGRRFRRQQFVLWRPLDRLPDVQQRVDELLAAAGLADLRDVEVRYLSYGHQRQVEIALALAADPAVLLLDEPTAGLSQAEMPAMLRLLKALPDDLTILVVEHNLELIFEVVERVVVLHQGRVLLDAPPQQVRADAEVRRLYLGSRAAERAG